MGEGYHAVTTQRTMRQHKERKMRQGHHGRTIKRKQNAPTKKENKLGQPQAPPTKIGQEQAPEPTTKREQKQEKGITH